MAELKNGTEQIIIEINKLQEVEAQHVRAGAGLPYFTVHESFSDGATRVENQPMREQRHEREKTQGGSDPRY